MVGRKERGVASALCCLVGEREGVRGWDGTKPVAGQWLCTFGLFARPISTGTVCSLPCTYHRRSNVIPMFLSAVCAETCVCNSNITNTLFHEMNDKAWCYCSSQERAASNEQWAPSVRHAAYCLLRAGSKSSPGASLRPRLPHPFFQAFLLTPHPRPHPHPRAIPRYLTHNVVRTSWPLCIPLWPRHRTSPPARPPARVRVGVHIHTCYVFFFLLHSVCV